MPPAGRVGRRVWAGTSDGGFKRYRLLNPNTNAAHSCDTVREQCSEQEYKAYMKSTAGIAGSIVMDVMEPLYKKHPQLKPDNWDDDRTGWK